MYGLNAFLRDFLTVRKLSSLICAPWRTEKKQGDHREVVLAPAVLELDQAASWNLNKRVPMVKSEYQDRNNKKHSKDIQALYKLSHSYV